MNDKKVLLLMAELSQGTAKGKAALRADLDPRTARKYRRSGKLPSASQPVHNWRTRPDPFAADWPEVVALLELTPALKPYVLFEHLQAEHPGRHQPGEIRTLERRINIWKAQYGPDLEVFFQQNHRVGEASQTDFTNCDELLVTIGGESLPHLLCHFVLPYSNWQWVTVCKSESLLALRRGMQAALFQLGRVPEWAQTDNSTAATHHLPKGQARPVSDEEVSSQGRDFNQEYEAVVRHLGMRPRTIGVRKSEQNGDVESANGVLKRRLEQHFLLRRSRDFATVLDYEQWAQSVCVMANLSRSKRVAQELAVMKPLTAKRLAEYVPELVPVSLWSTVRVRDNAYSVPSRLIGQTVQARIFEDHLEIWFAGRRELSVDRFLGRGSALINYRHIIWSLMRKPGAFARYYYREELFPTLVFRRAYDALAAAKATERTADVSYVRILHHAASTMQTEVETALQLLLEAGEVPTPERVKALTERTTQPARVTEMPALVPDLHTYDGLLSADMLRRETGT